MYLGGNVSENGRMEVEVRNRIHAGATAWRTVEGVGLMISRKLTGKVLDSCVRENNWIKILTGVERAKRMRMKDLR